MSTEDRLRDQISRLKDDIKRTDAANAQLNKTVEAKNIAITYLQSVIESKEEKINKYENASKLDTYDLEGKSNGGYNNWQEMTKVDMKESYSCHGDWVQYEDAIGYETRYNKLKDDITAIVLDSEGIEGWHLNGDIAHWTEFEFITELRISEDMVDELYN